MLHRPRRRAVIVSEAIARLINVADGVFPGGDREVTRILDAVADFVVVHGHGEEERRAAEEYQ